MHRYRIVNTPSTLLDQVSTSRGRSFGVPAQVIPFSPSSTKGALGLPKAKSWWERCTEYVLCPVYHGCIITAVLLQSIKFTNSVLFTTGSPQNQNHLSWDYLEEIQKWSKCFLFQKVNLSINFTVRFELHTQYVSSFDDIVKSHIIFLCISCS